MTDDELTAWVAASRKRQGLPTRITEPSVIARLAVLIAPTVPSPSGRRRKKTAAQPAESDDQRA